MKTATPPRPKRRHDLDWLRVIAFGLLIYFHAAIAFVPGGIPLIQNQTTSVTLAAAVAFLQQFRLALLFLISGAGVSFALRRRSEREFLAERSRRLLRPLAFGILFLVPPMVYLEKLSVGRFDGSLWTFYGRLLRDGVFPSGNLSWHHFWFLAYLYLFCLIGLSTFRRLRADGGRRVREVERELTPGHRLYLPILPLSLIEVALRWLFPGHRDLLHDWASFSVWYFVFLAGFVAASSDRLLDHTQKLRHRSLGLALAATALLFLAYWPAGRASFTPLENGTTTLPDYVAFCALRMTNLWAWLMAILGFAGAHLNRPGPVLRYLNDAVFPMFCVHLPLVVALGYVIVPLKMWLWSEFLLVATLATLLSLAAHHFLVRPGTVLTPWLGGRSHAAASRSRAPASIPPRPRRAAS